MINFTVENGDNEAKVAQSTPDTPDSAKEEAGTAASLSEEEIRQLHEDYRRFGIEGADEESMDSIADALSTFRSEDEEEGGQGKSAGTKESRKSDLSKKKFWIPILGVIAVVGVILYYAVLLPMLKTGSEDEEAPPINTWLLEQVQNGSMTEAQYTELLNQGKCEVLGTRNRILLFNHTEKADIQSVEVHNEFGTYTFYRDSSDNFAIKGAETVSYDKEMLSSLVVSSGYTLSMKRVSENCDNMAEYGLAPEDNPAYYTLTTTRGVTHTVYIGDPIPTGAGYYCSYEDRPAVYILDTTLASTLLADVRDLMTAVLAYPIGSTTYYTATNFVMEKNGEKFMEVDYLTDAERIQTASTSVWKMVYPEGGYTPSTTNYDAMLQTFISFVGDRLVEFNVLGLNTNEEITEERMAVLDKYGLAKPETKVSFDYTDDKQGYTVTNNVWISAMTENSTYYVYSWLFDVIGEVSAASYPWIGYDLLDFIDRPVFQKNINDVAKVEISGGEPGAEPLVSDFRLSGEGQELVVEEQFTGKVVETNNFRQLYKTMLTISIEDYTEDDSTNEEDLIATLKVTTRSGVETEYKFYSYSTRRCFMTINGKGEFYVLRDHVMKMVSDADKVIQGVPVSSDARS